MSILLLLFVMLIVTAVCSIISTSFSLYIIVQHMLVIGFILLTIWKYWRKEKLKIDKNRNRTLNNRWELWIISILVIIQAGLILVSTPILSGDITLEIVNTTLHSNQINQIHPLTGRPFIQSLTSMDKLVCYPILLAYLSKLFYNNVQVTLFGIVPIGILLLNVMIMYKISLSLLPDQKKGQAYFLISYLLVMLLGNYSVYSLPYRLYHYGYTGETFVLFVLLPLVIYKSLYYGKQGIFTVVACLIASVLLTGISYGFSYLIITAFIIYGIRVFLLLYDNMRRKRPWIQS